jgi:curved DNA-binding protein CbpA
MRSKREKPPEFYKLEEEVVGIIDDLELYSYYQLLELRQDADAAMVDYNYNLKVHEFRKLQKNIHCGAILMQNLERLIERMEEAYQVLSEADRRQEYDRGLELGQMRHPTVVQQRSLPMPKKVHQDQYLDKVTRGLEKKIPKEFLESEDNEGDEYQAIDHDYLDEALADLSAKLEKDKLDLHAEGGEEDVSADADFAGVVLEDIEAELGELGLDKDELGLKSKEEQQEARERKRLTEELSQSIAQVSAPPPGVTPLLQSLSQPAQAETSRPAIGTPSAFPRPEARPLPGPDAGGVGLIPLDDDGEEEDSGLPLRDEQGEQPYDEVIQLDEEDI